MALQALYFWQSRYNSSRAVSPLLCDRHRRRLCVCTCMLLYVPPMYEWSVCCQEQKTTKKSGGLWFSKAAAQPCSLKIIVQQQYRTAAQWQPCFKLSPFCQQSHAYVCVVGAQQEIEPRQHFHVQCSDKAHIVGPHTRPTKHRLQQQQKKNACVLSSSTCDAPRISNRPRILL